MLKCPYCFEVLEGRVNKCPHCQQFIIDEFIDVVYRGVDKKKCIFCGKKILSEARICKYCQRWIDEVDRAVDDMQGTE